MSTRDTINKNIWLLSSIRKQISQKNLEWDWEWKEKKIRKQNTERGVEKEEIKKLIGCKSSDIS